jgi:uncharacterized membrane protein HdeD (DUF308 family)
VAGHDNGRQKEAVLIMNTVLRALLLIAGLLQGVAGIYCLVHPGVTLLSLSLTIGFLLLFSGIAGIVEFSRVSRLSYRPGWVLVTSLLDVVMACLLLFTRASVGLAAGLPYMLAAWMTVRGIFLTATAFDLKAMQDGSWWAALLLGTLWVAFGTLSFFDPVVAAVTISVAVGIELLAMAIATGVIWWHWVQAHRALRRYQRAAREDWAAFSRDYPEQVDFIRSMLDREFLDW